MDDDTIMPHTASIELYSNANSTDKPIRLYEGLYHELLNEPEKEFVMNEIGEGLISPYPNIQTEKI